MQPNESGQLKRSLSLDKVKLRDENTKPKVLQPQGRSRSIATTIRRTCPKALLPRRWIEAKVRHLDFIVARQIEAELSVKKGPHAGCRSRRLPIPGVEPLPAGLLELEIFDQLAIRYLESNTDGRDVPRDAVLDARKLRSLPVHVFAAIKELAVHFDKHVILLIGEANDPSKTLIAPEYATFRRPDGERDAAYWARIIENEPATLARIPPARCN